ncbi:hypothetical protein [Floridanema aerugineum]|uniref:Transmembrane protein n=1 Tax=Floridaenema aerugineum BLCC-F46 TaxID=3153654 RepID=A0ABV4WY17_9CYAN
MAKNRLAQQRSPELPRFNKPALNQQGRRPVPPIQRSPRLKKTPKKQTIDERRKRVNPGLYQPLPWNQLVVQLIQKRPLLLLLTFCGGMLIVAGLAVIGMTFPEQGRKLKDQPTPAATAVSPAAESAIATPESLPNPAPTAENSPATTVTAQTQKNPPLGLYVTVGAGCAVGGWLLYRRRLKLAAKMRRKPLPKSLANQIEGTSPGKQKNSKPAKRTAPGSRKPLVAKPGKIPVADSIVRWPNGQSLPRNRHKLLKDTTASRRKQSISSGASTMVGDR